MPNPVFYFPIPNRRDHSSNCGSGICVGIFLILLVTSISLYCLTNFDFSSLEELVNKHTILFQEQGEIREAFNAFVEKFGKEYASKKEYEKRYKIFSDNYKFIQNHNQHNQDFTLGINRFTDMTREEFKKFAGKSKVSSIPNLKEAEMINSIADPIIDWDTKGYVSPVKYQDLCGSCWAFSAIGAVESLHAIKTGSVHNVMQYSEQELVDCSDNYGDMGCDGGFMTYAFHYIKDKGISKESEYPYEGRDDTCRKKSNSFQINGYVTVPANNNDQLLAALNIEPVSVTVEADEWTWQMYDGGIVTKDCGTDINHGVLLVGSGHDNTKNLDFWRIKNSWGTDWGENGYIRLKRQSGMGPGICGVAIATFYHTSA